MWSNLTDMTNNTVCECEELTIMRINDTSKFFEIEYDDRSSVHYPMRPPAAHQMRYADACIAGDVAPISPTHKELTPQEYEIVRLASEEQAKIDGQPVPVFDVPPPSHHPFTVTPSPTVESPMPVPPSSTWTPKVID